MGSGEQGIDFKKVLIFGSIAAISAGTLAYWLIKRKQKQKQLQQLNRQPSTCSLVEVSPELSNANLNEFVERLCSLTDAELDSLTRTDRLELASKARSKGNSCYHDKKMDEAITFYEASIRISPLDDKDASFAFCNKAACHLIQKNYEKAIEDATKALSLNPIYYKAFERRAKALDSLDRAEESIRDLLALCILEGFKGETTQKRFEDALHNFSEKKASEMFGSRQFILPSNFVITEFFNSFPYPLKIVSETQPLPQILQQAFKDMNEQQYEAACAGFKSFVENNGNSNNEQYKQFFALAHELYGSFAYLSGDLQLADSQFKKSLSLEPNNTNSMLKSAMLFAEKSDFDSLMQKVNQAIQLDPKDPTGYFHRSNYYELSASFESSLQDLTRAIQLKSDFTTAHLHKVRILLSAGKTDEAFAYANQLLSKEPNNPMFLNCLGEIFAVTEQAEKATKYFSEALKLDRTLSNAYCNQAIVFMTFQKDFAKAIDILTSCIVVDPKFESAHFQLGTAYLATGNIDSALSSFELAAKYTRSKDELVNICFTWIYNKIQYELLSENTELFKKFQLATTSQE